MAWKPCGLLPRRCVSRSAAPGCLNTLRFLPAGKQDFADSSPAMRIKVKVEAGVAAGSRAWQMAPSRPCSLAWSRPCGAQAVCGRARLEAELGASGGGGAGEVSPTEGWSFRSWVLADGREGLQSCSRGAASSAHQSSFVPSLSGSWKGRRGSPSSTTWGCDRGWGQGPEVGNSEVGVLGSVFLRHVVSTQGVQRCFTSSLISSCPGAQIP